MTVHKFGHHISEHWTKNISFYFNISLSGVNKLMSRYYTLNSGIDFYTFPIERGIVEYIHLTPALSNVFINGKQYTTIEGVTLNKGDVISFTKPVLHYVLGSSAPTASKIEPLYVEIVVKCPVMVN